MIEKHFVSLYVKNIVKLWVRRNYWEHGTRWMPHSNIFLTEFFSTINFISVHQAIFNLSWSFVIRHFTPLVKQNYVLFYT